MKQTIILVFAFVLLSQAGVMAKPLNNNPTDTAKVVSWITKNAIPIQSVDINTGDEDLSKLASLLKDKKIIALGDGTHGTKEFFLLKHRLIKYLVKNRNLKVVAMELPIDVGAHINDYVRTGEGDIDELLNDAWWWHKSQEIKDFIVWMKDYNKGLPESEKISFYGFDSQVHGDNNYQLLQYLKKVDEKYDETIQPLVDFMGELFIYDYDMFTPHRIAKWDTMMATLQNTMEVNKEKYINNSSKAAYLLAKARLNTLAGNVEEQKHAFFFDDFEVRDRTNAENIKLLSEIAGVDGKMVLWAHNDHLTTDNYMMQEFFCLTTTNGFYKENTVPKESVTGYLLQKELGSSYLNIGFEFYEGSFTAIEYQKKPKAFTVSAPEANTLSFLLNKPQINSNCYFLELSKSKMDNTTAAYFYSEQFVQEIGAAYISRYVKQIPANSYDAIIFFRKTTASKLLE